MQSYRMKLSCLRCRDRKLKCDRAEPECKRCQTVGLQCLYPEKRKARASRHRSDIRHLDDRIEALEERWNTTAAPETYEAPPTPTTGPSDRPVKAVPANFEPETGTEKFLYSMVSGAKENIQNLSQQASEPATPWSQPGLNTAITRLDVALAQLAASNPCSGANESCEQKINLSSADIKSFIERFLNVIVPHMTIFESFTPFVDADFIRALPHIIDSPYAQLDPVMRVIYYAAIYLGQSLGTAEEHQTAVRIYYRLLQSVPKWLESAQGTHQDLLAAALTTWLAVNNFDYHLAWQFHSEACRFGDLLGVHRVDLDSSKTMDETEKESQRRLHWYLVEMDFLFRLWYDKPKALRCPETKVQLPAVIQPDKKQPRAYESIIFIVWSRGMHIVAQFFNDLAVVPTEGLGGKIDQHCNDVIELLDDWDLLSVARSPQVTKVKGWLYVECLISFYGIVILMRRRAPGPDAMLHPQAIQASRTIMSIIDEWAEKNTPDNPDYHGFNTHLVTFYPFCAFFTLYYHILTSTEFEECKDDLCAMEKVVKLIEDTSCIRTDFVPIANAMRALNDVSRALHVGRHPVVYPANPAGSGGQASMNVPAQRQQMPTANTPSFPTVESLQNLNADMSLPPDDFSGAFGIPFQLQNQVAFDWDPSASRPGTAGTISQPVDLVRAIESELIWRDWHESWWNPQETNTDVGPGPEFV